jgi:hypothetical protein
MVNSSKRFKPFRLSAISHVSYQLESFAFRTSRSHSASTCCCIKSISASASRCGGGSGAVRGGRGTLDPGVHVGFIVIIADENTILVAFHGAPRLSTAKTGKVCT